MKSVGESVARQSAIFGAVANEVTNFAQNAIGSALANLQRIHAETHDYIATSMRFSETIGTSTEFFTRFVQAADDAAVEMRGTGVEIDSVGMSLQRLVQAGGRGRIEEVLGLNTSGMSSEDTILAVADAVAALQSPQERAAVGAQLFGRAWTDVIPVLAKGKDGVKELMGAVDDARIITDKDQAAWRAYSKALDEANDKREAAERQSKQLLGLEIAYQNYLTQMMRGQSVYGGVVEAVTTAMRMYRDELSRTTTEAQQIVIANDAVTWTMDQSAEAVGTSAMVWENYRAKVATEADAAKEAAKKATEEMRDAAIEHMKRAQEAVDAFFRSFGQKPPKPGKETIMEWVKQLIPNPQQGAANIESGLLGNMATDAFTKYGVPMEKLAPILKDVNDGQINFAQGAQKLIELAPGLGTAYGKLIGDLGNVEKIVGAGGMAQGVKTVPKTVAVPPDPSAAGDLTILEGKIASLEKRKGELLKGTDAGTPITKGMVEQIDRDIAALVAQKPAIQARIVGGYRTVTTIDPASLNETANPFQSSQMTMIAEDTGRNISEAIGTGAKTAVEKGALNPAVEKIIETVPLTVLSDDNVKAFQDTGSKIMDALARGLTGNQGVFRKAVENALREAIYDYAVKLVDDLVRRGR